MAALVGGWDGKKELASAKLLVFDDSKKGMHWEALPPLAAPVVNPAVCSDGAGRLVVAGGKRGSDCLRECWSWTAADGVWKPMPQLRLARAGARAVRLVDGRMLILGGSRGAADLASSEYFDAARGAWAGGPAMLSARRNFGAAVMPCGRVVVAGGFGGGGPPPPVAGVSPAGSLGFGTWLGAAGAHAGPDPAAEVCVSRTPLAQPRDRLSSAEVFDPASSRWSMLPRMSTERDGCALCVLSADSFGVFGGCGNGSYQRVCEVFRFSTGEWSALSPMSIGRAGCAGALGPSSVRMPLGVPIVLGGACDENPVAIQYLKSLECFEMVEEGDEGEGEWVSKPEMDTARQWAGLCEYSP